MKKLKRIFSLMIAMVMVLAMNMTVFAEEPTYSITVLNTKSSVSINGKTYSAYKIFNASNTDGKIEYSYDENDQSLLKVSYTPTGGSQLSGDDLIVWLSKQQNNPDVVRDFADHVYKTFIQNNTVTASGFEVASNERAVIDLTSAGPGYYLVYGEADPKDGVNDDEVVVAAVALTTANPTGTVNPKLNAPELEKTILHNESDTWGVVGDNQIGDTVYFRTITTVPDTNGYESYTYYICDIMDPQFDFNKDVEIYVGEKKENNTANKLSDDYYTVTYNNAKDGDTSVTFRVDIKIMEALKDGVLSSDSTATNNKLYTYYSGVLKANAKIYTDGPQANEAYLKYSNNPYYEGEGETVHDKVYDWTFRMTVNKVDQAGKALPGAKFVLAEDKSNLKVDEIYSEGNVTPTEGLIQFIKKEDGTYTVAPTGYTENNEGETLTYIIEGSTAHINGLDDATEYYLYEVEAPQNYNMLTKPVKFEINASYNETGDHYKNVNANITIEGKESTEANLVAKVVNRIGTTLPETGGIGTRIFYAVGAVLMIGAAVLLITRKRTRK